MIKSINESTLIPLGLAVLVIGSATAWVTEINGKVKYNTAIIDSLRASREENVKLNYEINSRLSRIEWKLEKGEK